MAGTLVTWYFTYVVGTNEDFKSNRMTEMVLAAQKTNPELFSKVRHIHGPAGCPSPENHTKSMHEVIEATGFFFLAHPDNQFLGAVEWECGNWMISVYDLFFEQKFHYVTMPDKRTAMRVAARANREIVFRLDRRTKRITVQDYIT